MRSARQSSRRVSRGGFTLIELLVVIAVICLLATLIVPVLGRAAGLAMRRKCGNNLRAIVKGCQAYAEASAMHRGSNYGRALPTRGENLITTSNWGHKIYGNPGALWLLIRYEFVPRKFFVCPEAKARRRFKAPAETDTNFEGNTWSYSYLSQVAIQGATGIWKYATSLLDPGLYTTLPILADQNPKCTFSGSSWTISGGDVGNSENHRLEGQNVGFLNGAVEWWEDPWVSVGLSLTDIAGNRQPNHEDNIYRAGSGSLNGRRSNLNDGFLIP